MRKMETWATGLLWAGLAFLLPLAALEPVSRASVKAAAGSLAATACADGSAHLVMGCAGTLL